MGLLNEVVDDEDLRARTRALAEGIAAGPPIALRYMKENLNRELISDLRTALALEADRLVRSSRTKDHRQAVQVFKNKRPPVFKGEGYSTVLSTVACSARSLRAHSLHRYRYAETRSPGLLRLSPPDIAKH